MVVGEVENGKKKKAMGNDDGKEVEMCKDDKGDEKVVGVATKGVLQFPTKEEEGVKGGEKGTFSQWRGGGQKGARKNIAIFDMSIGNELLTNILFNFFL